MDNPLNPLNHLNPLFATGITICCVIFYHITACIKSKSLHQIKPRRISRAFLDPLDI